MQKNIEYRVVKSESDYHKFKIIMLEYLETLAIDTTYMNLQDEFETMEDKYSGSKGTLILALDEGEAVGCVGVRELEPGIAELKRLYVKSSYRGLKVGVLLLKKALQCATGLKYQKIRLDVIPSLKKAKDLYLSLGFYEIAPYFNNPVEGTAYMEKVLKGDRE